MAERIRYTITNSNYTAVTADPEYAAELIIRNAAPKSREEADKVRRELIGWANSNRQRDAAKAVQVDGKWYTVNKNTRERRQPSQTNPDYHA